MASRSTSQRQRVAVVTGGGGGIGAAIAEELGRAGTFVVTLDPMVSVDGTEQASSAEETTADRIVAAGGTARASSASVTDREGVARLFRELADEFGGLDAVVNVAGITRPTSFTRGTEDDWRRVLAVHLDGYRNVLDAALPIMAAAGSGHVLGVTSGSGWRPADTGAYGCAKRAVAALTWQLGRHAPPGVVVNAISPIAMTRMVTAALGRSRSADGPPSGAASTGGLSLGSMPSPEQLGPLAAHLVGGGFSACTGRVVFTAGSEVAVIDEPRLLEVVGTEAAASLAHVLEVVAPGALVPAEADQRSTGGSNARFAVDPGDPAGALPAPAVRCCAVVSEGGNRVDEAVVAALGARGVTCVRVTADPEGGFEAAAGALAEVDTDDLPLDAVVLARAGGPRAAAAASGWERVLTDHAGIVEHILSDASWARAVADLSARGERPIRLLTLTDAATSGGRSRAQASAQLARAARRATDDRVTAFAVGVEGDDDRAVGELAAHLLCSPEALGLSGAELVVDAGSIGLRSHPRVSAGLTLGGPVIPGWFDDALKSIVG